MALSAQPIRVDTVVGPVIGRSFGASNVFKGLRYAKPPLRELRFRPPQVLEPWTNPIDAGEFGASPQQIPMPMIGEIAPMNEDCLTLNVWSPSTPGPHPVVFWIYGGANVVGSSSQPLYDGAKFAESGLVFVSANYRLGAFGFLELGPILPQYAGSGLNGLNDLIAALRWVHDAISAFGGDPSSVTLMGESAGAKNICALMTSPAARGLFNRVGIQSGGGQTVYRSPDEAAPVANAFLAATGLNHSDASRLATMLASDLIAAEAAILKSWPAGFPFRPTLDAAVLPFRPVDAIALGVLRKIEMIIGSCRDEAALFLPEAQAKNPIESRLVANVPFRVMEDVERPYNLVFPDESVSSRHIRALTAEEYWIPSLRFAEAHFAAGGKVWMYRFDQGDNVSGSACNYAHHGVDVPYVFDAVQKTDGATSTAAIDLAARVHDLWVGWALRGDVNIAGAPSWPKYDLQRRSTMVIASECVVIDDPNSEERKIWTGLL